jgi:hypothetical protein
MIVEAMTAVLRMVVNTPWKRDHEGRRPWRKRTRRHGGNYFGFHDGGFVVAKL